MLKLVLLLSVAAAARACDVCVAGVCHQPVDVQRGFRVTDQLAIDHHHDHSVLYMQLEGNLNSRVDLDEFMLVRIDPRRHTSGMAVDQRSRALYLSGETRTLYRNEWPQTTAVESGTLLHEDADRLFFKGVLYYTTKTGTGLNMIEKDRSEPFKHLLDYNITDFVVDERNNIYFVSDDKVYVYHKDGSHTPALVAQKKYALSTDKYGDVYLGDATEKAIYKLDVSRKLSLYAAYTEQSVDRFVFDKDNNIVFSDPQSEKVGVWKSKGTKCVAEPPHLKYIIKDASELEAPCATTSEYPSDR